MNTYQNQSPSIQVDTKRNENSPLTYKKSRMRAVGPICARLFKKFLFNAVGAASCAGGIVLGKLFIDAVNEEYLSDFLYDMKKISYGIIVICSVNLGVYVLKIALSCCQGGYRAGKAVSHLLDRLRDVRHLSRRYIYKPV